jgi:hypothetical protein
LDPAIAGVVTVKKPTAINKINATNKDLFITSLLLFLKVTFE